MRIPAIKGIIDRRILINFSVDPDIAKTIVPAPFTPKIIKGKAIAGICFIRLKDVRPKGLPSFIGFGSENGAHRIAVQWNENGKKKDGVFIPRRDTSSRFNALVGGWLFPGLHYRAKFDVEERIGHYHVAFKSSDGALINIDADVAVNLPKDSIFEDMETVSAFFETGSTGYSSNKNGYDGLTLKTNSWNMQPLQVSNIKSSYFEDEHIFPKGSIQFDNALLMTNIEHEWESTPCQF